jgi:pimeloyl-ACP methyl ester carboxylesterase
MKELFLLSGLGADRRVFDFLDLSPYRITHVEWIVALPDETIEQYASRLLNQIAHPNPILLGVSFGGMMAIEIGKLLKTEKIILLSSAKTQTDIPWQFRWIGKLKFHHLIPSTTLTKPNAGLYHMFSVTEAWEKELLDTIVTDTDPIFLRWALDRIIGWQNKTTLSNLTCIHGTADRLFPHTQGDYKIAEGGHFMVVNRAAEISTLLHSIV